MLSHPSIRVLSAIFLLLALSIWLRRPPYSPPLDIKRPEPQKIVREPSLFPDE
jgi:hypothetical protein